MDSNCKKSATHPYCKKKDVIIALEIDMLKKNRFVWGVELIKTRGFNCDEYGVWIFFHQVSL